MTSRPSEGALVWHRSIGKQTTYRVVSRNGRRTASAQCVIVTHATGPLGRCDRGEYPDGWNADISNLTYAHPRALLVPEGM